MGPLTSLVFVLALNDDPRRLNSSRAAGAFVGLRPKRRDSGKSSPELSVTRNGDRLLRRLPVQCAQYILGPSAPTARCAAGAWGRPPASWPSCCTSCGVATKDFNPRRGTAGPG